MMERKGAYVYDSDSRGCFVQNYGMGEKFRYNHRSELSKILAEYRAMKARYKALTAGKE